MNDISWPIARGKHGESLSLRTSLSFGSLAPVGIWEKGEKGMVHEPLFSFSRVGEKDCIFSFCGRAPTPRVKDRGIYCRDILKMEISIGKE